MNYVVTGSEGFLGRNITNRLLANGHRVVGYDNLSRGHRTIRHAHYQLIQKSILEDELDFGGIDCVIHAAAVNGTDTFYREPWRVLEVGIQGTLNVIDACKEYEVREFLFLSSSETYSTPQTIPTPETTALQIPDILNPRFSYAVSKIAGEALVLNAGFRRAIIIRPHNIYGPDSGMGHVIPDLIAKMRDDRVEIQGTGKETRAFMYVDDFVDAFMLILQKGQDRDLYHVGSGEEVTIERVAKEIGRQSGRTIEIVPGILRPGSPPRRCPDVHKLESLGFIPKTSIKEGIAKTVAWYRGN